MARRKKVEFFMWFVCGSVLSVMFVLFEGFSKVFKEGNNVH